MSDKYKESETPLAERMRPQSLSEFLGQAHLVGPKGVLTRMAENGYLPSLIFWGPPGTGKTTLAKILADMLHITLFTVNAVSSGVKEVREVIEKAEKQGRCILFIDEIHRFNKAQQDALLNAVERGTITLIGATTENPSFEVIPALLSRCRVYTLHTLGKEELTTLLKRATREDCILKEKNIQIEETEALLRIADGDARRLLNLLELTVLSEPNNSVVVTDKAVMEAAQHQTVLYDKNGERHYDIISAFIKSLRGSDPNAAIYWLAVMIEGGEDPKFIARRMLILASEDIGNANPTALVMATACFQAVTYIGYPEADLILSQTATYLASSAKSNASYTAIGKAKELVRRFGSLPVPLHLRNAPTRLMKKEGYGKGYNYPHDEEESFSFQEYLPSEIAGTVLYEPKENPREQELRERLRKLWGKKYGY